MRVESTRPLPVARITLAIDAPVSRITPVISRNTTRMSTPTSWTSRCVSW